MTTRQAYDNIHFDEERWLEFCGYPLGEDLMFINKFYQCGYSVMVHFDCDITHLDAGGNSRRDYEQLFVHSQMLRYLIWHRISYETANSRISRLYRKLCFAWSTALQSLIDVARLVGPGRFMLFARYRGIKEGKRLLDNGIFRDIPSFDSHKKFL